MQLINILKFIAIYFNPILVGPKKHPLHKTPSHWQKNNSPMWDFNNSNKLAKVPYSVFKWKKRRDASRRVLLLFFIFSPLKFWCILRNRLLTKRSTVRHEIGRGIRKAKSCVLAFILYSLSSDSMMISTATIFRSWIVKPIPTILSRDILLETGGRFVWAEDKSPSLVLKTNRPPFSY